MDQIQRVSTFFRVLFQVAFIAAVAINLLAWLQAPEPLVFISKDSGVVFSVMPSGVPLYSAMTGTQKLAGFVISLMPLLLQLYIIYCLIVLFGLYEQGKIFFIENVNVIKRIGVLLVINQLIYPLYEAAMTLMLTWHNPVGERLLSFSLSGTNIGLLVTGVMIILVSWIMAEGCKLREEHDLTV